MAINFAKGNQLTKATATARVLGSKPELTVYEGPAHQGPCTAGNDIFMGTSMQWDAVDRYGVLIHEICHHLFPAKYPSNVLRELANVIDDTRIERQFVASRSWHANALAVLAINVIANGKYQDKDKAEAKWTVDGFDPSLWALLWFRTYLPAEVRDAARDAIEAYARKENLWDDAEWRKSFEKLIADGLSIGRKKRVSTKTLEAWCLAYTQVFPNAKQDPNDIASGMLSDQDQGTGKGQDQEGEGDKGDDQAQAQQASQDGGGESGDEEGDEEGQGSGAGDQDESEGAAQGGQEDAQGDEKGGKGADASKDLEKALDALRDAMAKAGEELEGEVTDKMGDATEGAGEGGDQGDGSDDDDDEVDDAPPANSAGLNRAKPVKTPGTQARVEKSFITRVKRAVRKLRCIAQDRDRTHKKAGRLDIRVAMKAERKGVLPRKPFIRKADIVKDVPVACAVCTDFSSSTSSINGQLNAFAHNATFALQAAGCETSEVVWNGGYQIVANVEDTVSPVSHHRHSSNGGTCLGAAVAGAIKSLHGARATRKVAFIFTDGELWNADEELREANTALKRAGFEGAMLVSLGNNVPAQGIIKTYNASNIPVLASVFDQFVKAQVAVAEALV